MKNTFFTAMLLGLFILWAGCSGPSTEPVGEPDEESASPGARTAPGGESTVGEITNIVVPSWYVNIPDDPNYLYAVGTNASMVLEMATNTAKSQATNNLTSQMQTKVSGMFKRFLEEVGLGEDAEFTAMATSVSKEVYSEVLSGSRPAKQEILKEDKLFNVYVLYELPVGAMNAALVDKVKANKAMYDRFRASQGFKELEEEVAKYEEWKKEQGM